MPLLAVCHVELNHALLDLTLHFVLSRVTGLDLGDDEGSVLEKRALEEGDLRMGREGSPFLLLLGR